MILLLNGCAKRDVRVVFVSDFCAGRYYSIRELDKKDFKTIDRLRKVETSRVTIDKLLRNIYINEKEFEICLDDGFKQTKKTTRD
jgi:hypothetical protein